MPENSFGFLTISYSVFTASPLLMIIFCDDGQKRCVVFAIHIKNRCLTPILCNEHYKLHRSFVVLKYRAGLSFCFFKNFLLGFYGDPASYDYILRRRPKKMCYFSIHIKNRCLTPILWNQKLITAPKFRRPRIPCRRILLVF